MKSIDSVRSQFPSLLNKDDKGNQVLYLDGPGGTQVPTSVINSVSDYYKECNSNTHGEFLSSKKTDDVMESMREKVSMFLGAESKECISIGHNMTTLNFSLARAFSKMFKVGDEVIVTELDHEANRGPWRTLENVGVKLIEVKLLKDGSLDYVDFKNKINDKTVLVAMGMSSNSLGTVNDFMKVKDFLQNHNALFLLDAVHYAPHFSIDVQNLGCDFLLCSAYKFYGPHIGLLYSKPNLLEKIQPERLVVQDQFAPFIIETGTLNHAACNGVSSAIDFIASLGKGATYKEKLVDAYRVVGKHEFELASHLYSELNKLEKINVVGKDFKSKKRSPTVSFVHDDLTANEVCQKLAQENICAWDGHFYALKSIQALGLEEKGGVTRLGISVYNTLDEIERTIQAVSKI